MSGDVTSKPKPYCPFLKRDCVKHCALVVLQRSKTGDGKMLEQQICSITHFVMLFHHSLVPRKSILDLPKGIFGGKKN